MPWENVQPELTRLHRFIHLAASGLQSGLEATRSVEQQRKIAHVLGRSDPFPDENAYQDALCHAAELETFAREQQAAHFSYLHELGLVKLWSVLESAIDELAFQRLADENAREHESLVSIEGPLLPFLSSSPEEQSEFLLAKLKIAVKAGLQRGVGRFEALLNPLGLGGRVEPLVARAFIDLSETRHVIVHRGGVADRQFLDRCPWRTVSLGERLYVTKRQFDWHSCAVDWYVVEVDARLENVRGGARPVDHDALLLELATTLDQLAPADAV